MGRALEQSLLDEWLERIANKKNVFSTVLCVEDQEQSLSLVSAAGNED